MENKNKGDTLQTAETVGATETAKQKEVVFNNCPTCGDEIKALVVFFTDHQLGNFVLERALEEVQKNNKKIEEFKAKLLKRGK